VIVEDVEKPAPNGKTRSRKWLLAIAAFVAAMLGWAAAEYSAFWLLVEGLISAEIYADMVKFTRYWWGFTTIGILGGYGIPNVAEKWRPKGGM